MKKLDSEGREVGVGDNVVFIANGYPARGYIYKYDSNKNKLYMTSNPKGVKPFPHAHKELSGGVQTNGTGNQCWFIIKL